MIERASANDLMQLASDVGPVPMHIAGVLLLDPPTGFDLDAACGVVGQRLSRVRRLRQRLVPVPVGCGRPVWVDDSRFDPSHHVAVAACRAPGDLTAVLDTALGIIQQPLPRARPLWSATFVTGLGDGGLALVVVMHHVLADGLGGLAVLAELVDAAPSRPTPHERWHPQPAPSRRALLTEAWSVRLRSLADLPASLRRLRTAGAELGGGSRPSFAPRSSLNRPTGAHRAAGTARADLDAVIASAHREGATVNDVVLTAVTGALGALLTVRGEQSEQLVVSVPVAARTSTGLGNRVGAMPVRLPTTGEPFPRLRAIAAITRAGKTATPGASAAMLQPVFRALAALGVLGWLINRQRLVNTFVTNVRGPADPLCLAGARVLEIIPIAGAYGNATVAFAALSYAGRLTITVLGDPDAVPELPALTTWLQHQLDALTRAPEPATNP